MKIGILTFHRALNCGAVLQAWALKTFLEKDGHRVSFIPNHVGSVPRWFPLPQTGSFLGRGRGALLAVAKNVGSFGCLDVAIRRFGAFRNHWLPEISVADCDVIIIGSDQVWRPELTRGETALFQGAALPPGLPVLSYAASYGDRMLGEDDLRQLASCLNRFSAVSVREPLVKAQISTSFSGDVEVVADPTLLLKAEDYAAISCAPALRKPYLFAYAVHATPFFVKTAHELAYRMGLELVMTSTSQYTRWCAPSGLAYAVSPDRMVGYVRGASCVIASSFHGTALSVIHGKPFVSLRETENNDNSRPAAFLSRIEAKERLVTPSTSVSRIQDLLMTAIEKASLAKLDEFAAQSSAWLRRAIKIR